MPEQVTCFMCGGEGGWFDWDVYDCDEDGWVECWECDGTGERDPEEDDDA